MTHAAIVPGSSPGSTSISVTFVTSTAIGGGRLPCRLCRFGHLGHGRGLLRLTGRVWPADRLAADGPDGEHRAQYGDAAGQPHAAGEGVDEGVVGGIGRRR